MTNKKLRNSIIAVSLVTVVGIGGTLAYLSAATDTKTNVFTMGAGIEGDIDEPNWDPKEAVEYTPGKIIAKDPIILNESADTTDPAFVGAVLTYQVADGTNADGTTKWADTTFADLDQFINIQSGNPLTAGFNTTDWEFSADHTKAYYKTKLAAGAATAPIFDAVEIDKYALTPDQIESAVGTNPQFDVTKYNTTDADGNVIAVYTTYQMKDFQIVVKGYLAQGSDEFTSAENAMVSVFSDVFHN